uniref:Uncharacterized protein n=1 Tax=Parascaris univalens TaxID=6257 RepID=A0A915B0T2_PARUN
YIAETKPDIELYPRYYLYEGQYNKFRMFARHFHLLPGHEHCSNEYSTVGKATCYLTKWLVDNLEEPYQCTFPYMDKIRNVSLPSCDAGILVKHYRNTVNAESYFSHDCTLPCTRWEYTIVVDRTEGPPTDESDNRSAYAFRADISFNDLQYEEITEVHVLSFFGLLAQIGGQLSLFLGASIMSIIQVFLMLFILSKRSLTQRRESTQMITTPFTESEVKRNISEGEMSLANNFHVNNPELYAPISKRQVKTDERINNAI